MPLVMCERWESNILLWSDSSSLGPDIQQDYLSAGTERAWGEILERACSVSQEDWEEGRPGGKTREDLARTGPGENGGLDVRM